MIRITIYKNHENRYTGFKSLGHAGFADHGQDIVCAAISILTINTINSIETFTSDRILVDTNEKKARIIVTFKEPISDEATLLLDSMTLGISEIKNNYGEEYITLNFKEV